MVFISMPLMATLTISPLPITAIPTKFLMDLEVTWDERCQLLKEETGLNVLLPLELEGMFSSQTTVTPHRIYNGHVRGEPHLLTLPLFRCLYAFESIC